MSTISVPINSKLESVLNNLIKSGFAENKAEAMRKALLHLAENEAVLAVIKSEQEAKEGLIFRGVLQKLIKKAK